MSFVCPAKLTHAPLITTKVDRTYVFLLIRRDLGQRPDPDNTMAGYPIQQEASKHALGTEDSAAQRHEDAKASDGLTRILRMRNSINPSKRRYKP